MGKSIYQVTHLRSRPSGQALLFEGLNSTPTESCYVHLHCAILSNEHMAEQTDRICWTYNGLGSEPDEGK